MRRYTYTFSNAQNEGCQVPNSRSRDSVDVNLDLPDLLARLVDARACIFESRLSKPVMHRYLEGLICPQGWNEASQ